jgi:hypothetical protein
MDNSVRLPCARRDNNPPPLKSPQWDIDNVVRELRFDRDTSVVSMPTPPKRERCSREFGKGEQEKWDEDEE